MTPEEKRRRRLQELAAKVKAESPCDRRKLSGWGCIRWGCRGERVNEYLEVLEMAGLIEISKEAVTWSS